MILYNTVARLYKMRQKVASQEVCRQRMAKNVDKKRSIKTRLSILKSKRAKTAPRGGTRAFICRYVCSTVKSAYPAYMRKKVHVQEERGIRASLKHDHRIVSCKGISIKWLRFDI